MFFGQFETSYRIALTIPAVSIDCVTTSIKPRGEVNNKGPVAVNELLVTEMTNLLDNFEVLWFLSLSL